MKLVVLNGHTLNPGDLSWGPLEELAVCTVYPRTPPEDVFARAAEADLVLTNKTVLDRCLIEALPKLQYIGVLATGYNVVDLPAARERGIPVTNVPAYSTASVAQMVFALLFELTRRAGRHARLVREGRWTVSPDFCFWDTQQIELNGLTLGLFGFGAIGREVARLARAFGMAVLVHTRHPDRHRDDPEAREVRFVRQQELFRQSDILSLHCPLTPETEGLIDTERLALMKPAAFLVNTSRGGLVDEAALAAALNEGRLAGAGLDVLSVEPPPAGNPLLQTKNCLITPHIAWATRSARERLLAAAAANVRSFLSGCPQNVVNP